MISGTYRILLAGICIAGAGPQIGVADAPGRFTGAGSCAAAACHGSAISRNPKGSEYSIWIQSDRHAMAYTTLFSQRSQAIARNLELKGGAHTAVQCLKCHSLSVDSGETAPGRPSALADGVSCEACHGPAEHWLEPHKRRDWKTLNASEKSQLGFHDTKTILSRTTECVRCHVGEPGRDVNHDLIAAGHPRLYFEMSAYQAKMPRHWDRAGDLRRNPGLEAKLWVVGQLATADAALRLLECRVSQKADIPWPEFAEYACFACHHDLATPRWRQNLPAAGKPGLFQWGTWNFSMAKDLVGARGGAEAARTLQGNLESLAGLMSQSAPLQDKVANQARALRTKFRKWAEDADQGCYEPDDLHALMASLLRDVAPQSTRDWEKATQLYLALAAIAQAEQEVATNGAAPFDPAVFDELKGLRILLQFPLDRPDSKRRLSSPADFDAKRIDELDSKFQRLREMIERK